MTIAIATIYAVFGDSAEAERIGRAMVEARLAACVNILAPCRSIYRWDGAVETAEEVPALFKTSMERADALIAAIAGAHGYDVPAIVMMPAERTTDDYAAWIVSQVATVS